MIFITSEPGQHKKELTKILEKFQEKIDNEGVQAHTAYLQLILTTGKSTQQWSYAHSANKGPKIIMVILTKLTATKMP